MKRALVLLFIFALPLLSWAQSSRNFQVGCIGFYNFENLFDTLDAPHVNDQDFTPQGSYRYNTEIYVDKLDKLARVVAELGTEITPDGVAILGIAELETRKPLEDFINHPKLKSRNYQIVHYESPDERGIDVALIYQPKYFKVTASRSVPVPLPNNDFTRDILFVSGLYDGEPMHILVNHWPSRSGGEAASQPLRNLAATICKDIVDSLTKVDPNAKIVLMGDLNDDPTSPSVRTILDAKGKKEQVEKGGLYNTMYDFYKKGIGTLAYQDSWSLFDQIIISYGLINPKAGGYQFYQAQVHNKAYMSQQTGQFKGYPLRTFVGTNYIGGYSDHFPTYIFLIKEVNVRP
ncbi:MAG: endonuclease/exonuclease/phosphatase family protein [Saprospiraceae bacterium]